MHEASDAHVFMSVTQHDFAWVTYTDFEDLICRHVLLRCNALARSTQRRGGGWTHPRGITRARYMAGGGLL